MKWSYIEEMTCKDCGENHKLEISGPLALEEHKRALKAGNKFSGEYVAYTAIGAPSVQCSCVGKEGTM